MNFWSSVRALLAERDPDAKALGTRAFWADWTERGAAIPPDAGPSIDSPGIPDRPLLAPPENMPRRQLSGPENHGALIHALTHIEFHAINLALDAVQRFSRLPADFHVDWLRIAAEEADHFLRLRAHLRDLDWEYGDFPAHAGLWDMASRTAHDPLARMALVPRLLEARGLDVTPDIQRKLRGYGDNAGAAILDVILRDEVGHVAVGDRWFRLLCAERGLDPGAEFQRLVEQPGIPHPRPPFNLPARLAAGFSREELDALARDYRPAGATRRPGKNAHTASASNS